jgi:hypothetical protein
LQPPIQFNVGQVPFEKLYHYVVPVIPGFTLLVALLLGQPAWFLQVSSELGLAGFAKVAVLVCAAYTCGFILHFVSLGITTILTTSLFPFILNKMSQKWEWLVPERPNYGFMKLSWRGVAEKFLGDLAPHRSLRGVASGKDGLDAYDAEWREWYNVLQEYIAKGPTLSSKGWTTSAALQASGWSVLIASFYIPALTHWPVLIPALLSILLGNGIPMYAFYRWPNYDRFSSWDFTAKLLAEVRRHEVVPVSADKPPEGS